MFYIINIWKEENGLIPYIVGDRINVKFIKKSLKKGLFNRRYSPIYSL